MLKELVLALLSGCVPYLRRIGALGARLPRPAAPRSPVAPRAALEPASRVGLSSLFPAFDD